MQFTNKMFSFVNKIKFTFILFYFYLPKIKLKGFGLQPSYPEIRSISPGDRHQKIRGSTFLKIQGGKSGGIQRAC